MKNTICTFILCLFIQSSFAQIGFGTTTPQSAFDFTSTTGGMLIPRMTTTQRDAITSPPNGLQIYNTTTNKLELYRSTRWEAVTFTNPTTNLVHVNSLSDLPTPASNAITLDANKMYVFSGVIDISPNYINLNGANLKGMDPSRDGVMSSVTGGIIRSTDVSVFMENFVIIPFGASTKAFDLADATGTKFCNIFSGCSVVEIGVPSLGVGQISGFKAITIDKNYWSCKDGIKVAGTVGKFCLAYTFINGLTSGSGVEFLSTLAIDDIDLSNNYFIYTGQIGVKVNTGAQIDRGRMTTNMFRGITTYTSGFDSYTSAWEMRQNTNIPNSRAYGFLYMNANATATSLTTSGVYYKVAGTTTTASTQRFTAASNRLTYTGKESITSKILAIIGAKTPANSSDFSIAIAKNGTVINNPSGSAAAASNNQSITIILATEITLVNGDYIEIFVKSNNINANTITVEDLQFRVTD